MSYLQHDLSVVVDGVPVPAATEFDPLSRAVMISIFTWRRADPDDELPDDGASRMGWWGDTYSDVQGDRIGSKLWLLSREKLTANTIRRAREYVEQALEWLVDDQVATRVEVSAERFGLDGLAITVRIFRADGSVKALQFSDVWSFLNA